MANRNQDNQSERGRGGYRGWEDDYEEGDSSARAGRFDDGRGRHGREINEQSGSTGRYAGYGEWGQGDYSGTGRGANTGQNRYGMSGGSGGGGEGYGQGNYGQSGYGGQSGSNYGRSNYSRSNQGSGRSDRERGDYGYGYGGSGDRGSDRGWSEPSGEGQQYGSQRGWEGGGSRHGGQRAGSGQSSGYAGPGYGYGGSGSPEFDYGGAQGGGSQYGGYGSESVFGGSRTFNSGSSRFSGSQGYGQNQGQDFGQGQGLHRGKGPKGYQRSDERVKEMISERLRDDPHIDASEITVTVTGGKVTLDGTVDSRQAKNAAEDIAEQCGCEDVQNNLRVQRAMESSSLGGTAGKSATDKDKDKGELGKQRH